MGRLGVMFLNPSKVLNESSGEGTNKGKGGIQERNERRRTLKQDAREKQKTFNSGLRLKVGALGKGKHSKVGNGFDLPIKLEDFGTYSRPVNRSKLAVHGRHD